MTVAFLATFSERFGQALIISMNLGYLRMIFCLLLLFGSAQAFFYLRLLYFDPVFPKLLNLQDKTFADLNAFIPVNQYGRSAILGEVDHALSVHLSYVRAFYHLGDISCAGMLVLSVAGLIVVIAGKNKKI
jgi:hypothetical protein